MVVWQISSESKPADNDRKAKASHCVPVSANTPGATPNNAIPGSGRTSLLQILENVSKMADQNGTRFWAAPEQMVQSGCHTFSVPKSLAHCSLR